MVATSIGALFEMFSEPVILTDAEGIVVGTNGAARGCAWGAACTEGVDLARFVDESARTLLQRFLRDQVDRCSVDVAEGNAPEFTAMGGTVVMTGMPLIGSDGTVESMVWLVREAAARPSMLPGYDAGTAMARTTATEFDTDGRYRQLVDRIPDITWTVREDGRKVYVSRHVEQILGYTPDEIYAGGANICELLLHPADIDQYRAAHMALFSDERPYAIECRFRRKDGAFVWVLDRAMQTFVVDGIRYADGVCTDITERKQRDADLELFGLLINQSEDSLFVIDAATGRLLDVNNAACMRLEYSRSEILAMHVVDFECRFEDTDAWRRHVADVRAAGSMIVEGEHRTSGGSTFPVEVNVKYVEVDRQGYLVAVVRDITARKEAEATMRKAYDILGKRMEERTAHVTALMDQARRSQVRFVAGASHDLRTPLTIVRAELDLLRQSGAVHDLTTREALERIDTESRRLDRLASDLLLLASFDSANPGEPARAIRVDELMLACVADTNTAFSSKQLVWDIHCDAAPLFTCAPAALERALASVLDNAAKYSPSGSAISIHVREEQGASITVIDRGTGIALGDLPNVFDRFYRSDRARSTSGHGLGLAIAKTVIESHGGTISIASESGIGTTVTITLPANE